MRTCLYDSEERRWLEAELGPLGPEHLDEVNQSWVPEFDRRQRLRERDEDFLVWGRPSSQADSLSSGDGAYRLVLTCQGRVQGMIVLQVASEPSRLQAGQCVLYVRYLATAPWNRPLEGKPGRYRGVGRALLAEAVRRSERAGCAGRLALHSLPGSDGFYRRLGFREFGPDPAHRGMNYLELDVPQARELLRSVDQLKC